MAFFCFNQLYLRFLVGATALIHCALKISLRRRREYPDHLHTQSPQGPFTVMQIYPFGQNARLMINHHLLETKFVVFPFAYKREWVQAGFFHSPAFLQRSTVLSSVFHYISCTFDISYWCDLQKVPTYVTEMWRKLRKSVRAQLGMTVRAMKPSNRPRRECMDRVREIPSLTSSDLAGTRILHRDITGSDFYGGANVEVVKQ